MAGTVNFKFKSERTFDHLLFDGIFISIAELKRMIGEKRSMPADELAIYQADTGQEFVDDGHLLPRNTQVLISRIPKAALSKKAINQHNAAAAAAALPMQPNFTSNVQYTGGVGPSGQQDEAAALSQFVDNTFDTWNSEVAAAGTRGTLGAKGRMRSEIPPPNYVCHRCGVGGHWIFNCPTNGNPEFDSKKVKAPVGIPLEKLMASNEGILVMPDGTVGDVMADDRLFEKETKVLKGRDVRDVPEEFRCPICQLLISDAVLIICCKSSYCDKCIRTNLINTGTCTNCGKENMLCDDLLPNPTLRRAIQNFLRSGPQTEPKPTKVEQPKPIGNVASTPLSISANVQNSNLQQVKPDVGPTKSEVMHNNQPVNVAPPQPPPPSVFQRAPVTSLGNFQKSNNFVQAKPKLKMSAFKIPTKKTIVETKPNEYKDAQMSERRNFHREEFISKAHGDATHGKSIARILSILKRVHKLLPKGKRDDVGYSFAREQPLSIAAFQGLQKELASVNGKGSHSSNHRKVSSPPRDESYRKRNSSPTLTKVTSPPREENNQKRRRGGEEIVYQKFL